jgi:hypothetical protein
VAAADGSPPRLRREERVAAELVRRFKLEPPIDVRATARRFADVDDASIPGTCDGLVLGLHGGRPRPLILFDPGQGRSRERFTLAHELGHVLLPWHVGDAFLCDTSRVRLFDVHAGVSAEPEANRFAAELLVPTAWLDWVMAELGTERAGPLMEAIRQAGVSAYVACLRLRARLPAGHAFVISRSDRVLLSGRTQGRGLYAVYPPEAGERFERERLDRFAHAVEDMEYGSTHVTWWTFRGEQFVEEHEADPRTSQQVLDELLERHIAKKATQAQVRQSLNGVIGAAHGEAKREGAVRAAELFVRFRGRFALHRRNVPDTMVHDDDFEVWLHKRAEELGESNAP